MISFYFLGFYGYSRLDPEELKLGTTGKSKHEVFVFGVWVTSVSITVSSPIHFLVKFIISFPVFWDVSTLISREPRQPGCSHIHSEWGPLSPRALPHSSSVVCTLGRANWGERESRGEHFLWRWFLATFISSLKILFGSQPVQKIPFYTSISYGMTMFAQQVQYFSFQTEVFSSFGVNGCARW